MSSYNSFAEVYDIFMEEVPYDDWIDFLYKIWDKHNITPNLVCELGCGTGNITQRLAKKGVDMIGIDLSMDMLMVAKDKNYDDETDTMYLMQDMRSFELFGTVDSIICMCDSLNYITNEHDLLKVFKLANNYLNPQGLFIFDLNTKYKFKSILGNNTFAETSDDSAYIWNNFFDEDTNTNIYDVTFFIKDADTQDYIRYEEEHEERAYDLDTVKSLLQQSGLTFIGAYDFDFATITDTTERMYIIAQENQKKAI